MPACTYLPATILSNSDACMPQDLEPDGRNYDLQNITIRDCYAVNNSGHGLQSWLNSGQARELSVLVERYHVIGPGPGSWQGDIAGGFVFGRMHPDAGGSIVIRDSTAVNTPFDGIYVWDEIEFDDGPSQPPFNLVFDNVSLTNTATAIGALSIYTNQPGFAPQLYAPIGLDSLATYGNSGLIFNNVVVRDALRRPFMQVRASVIDRSIDSATIVAHMHTAPCLLLVARQTRSGARGR